MKFKLSDKWEKVNLLTYLEFVKSGVKPFKGTKKYVDTGSLNTGEIINFVEVDYETKPSRANMITQEGDVLFAKMKDTEKVYLISDIDKNHLYSTGFAILRIKNKLKVLPGYIYFWLRSNEFQDKKNRECTGATQKAINENKLRLFTIILPPITIQQKIISILEKTENLKNMRKEADELLINLIKSLFEDTFGNVITNKKNWKLVRLSEVTNSRLGKMLDSKKQTQLENRKYLRNTNVKWDNFDLDEMVEMDFNELEREEFKLEKGDLLVCEGGDIARSAIWNNELTECYFQKALHRVKCNMDKIVPEYLLHLFWYYSENKGFEKIVNSATITHFTGIMLKNMLIPIPPISIQKKFRCALLDIKKTKSFQSEVEINIKKLSSLLEQNFFKVENF